MGVIIAAAYTSLALLHVASVGSGRVGESQERYCNLIVPCMKMSTSIEMTSPDLENARFQRQQRCSEYDMLRFTNKAAEKRICVCQSVAK